MSLGGDQSIECDKQLQFICLVTFQHQSEQWPNSCSLAGSNE